MESSFAGVLDFIEILDSLGLINKKVRTSSFWTEAPNLLGIIDVPTVLVSQGSGSFLLILLGRNLISLDGISEFISKWLSLDVDSVVLVW